MAEPRVQPAARHPPGISPIGTLPERPSTSSPQARSSERQRLSIQTESDGRARSSQNSQGSFTRHIPAHAWEGPMRMSMPPADQPGRHWHAGSRRSVSPITPGWSSQGALLSSPGKSGRPRQTLPTARSEMPQGWPNSLHDRDSIAAALARMAPSPSAHMLATHHLSVPSSPVRQQSPSVIMHCRFVGPGMTQPESPPNGLQRPSTTGSTSFRNSRFQLDSNRARQGFREAAKGRLRFRNDAKDGDNESTAGVGLAVEKSLTALRSLYESSRSTRDSRLESLNCPLTRRSLSKTMRTIKSYKGRFSEQYKQIADGGQHLSRGLIDEPDEVSPAKPSAISEAPEEPVVHGSWRQRLLHDADHLKKVAVVFKLLDINKDGKLSKREVIHAIMIGKLTPMADTSLTAIFEDVLPDGGAELLFQHFAASLNVHFTIELGKDEVLPMASVKDILNAEASMESIVSSASQQSRRPSNPFRQPHGAPPEPLSGSAWRKKKALKSGPMFRGRVIPAVALRLFKRTFGEISARGGAVLTAVEFYGRICKFAPELKDKAEQLYPKVLNKVNGTISFLRLLREVFFPSATGSEVVSIVFSTFPIYKSSVKANSPKVLEEVFDLFAEAFGERFEHTLTLRQMQNLLSALGYLPVECRLLSRLAMEDYALPGSFVPGSSVAPGVLPMRRFLKWHKDEMVFINMREGKSRASTKVHAVDVLWRLRNLSAAHADELAQADEHEAAQVPADALEADPETDAKQDVVVRDT